MIYIFSYLIISFLLDGIVSSLLPTDIILRPLFTFISILVIYPFFNYQKKDYFISIFLLGLLYDIVYTNTTFFHAFLFLGLGYLSSLWNQKFSNTSLNLLWMSIIFIFLYRFISYTLLLFLQVLPFHLYSFIYILLSSFLLNIIYIELSYFILNCFVKKRKLFRMN